MLIYARVSTNQQETDNQIIQLKKYVEIQQWEIFKVITDNVSGGKGISARKGLEDVFSLAHRRQYDVLLFWSLDRFSREGSRKTIEYLTQLESLKIEWHSYTEQYLSNIGPFSDVIISLLASLARQEKIRIGERTKAGLQRVRSMGIHIGRPKTPETKIADIIELRQQGLSMSAIGKRVGYTAARVCQLLKEQSKVNGGDSIAKG